MFSDPVKNLRAFHLKENSVVADLGAGTGFYSIAAGKLAPHGKIYAVELQKDFLTIIKSKISESRLRNIEIVWGNVEKIGGTKLGENTMDAVIASNVLFQVEKKDEFISEVRRILKTKGKVLLIDWSLSSVFRGADVVPKEKARAMFEEKGFVFETEIDAGEHHYGMIFIKN